MEKPGFPFAPHDKWLLAVDEWTVTADTREEAECKMLGLILRDGIGFPLFRSCANAEGQGCRASRHTLDPLVGASGSPKES